MLVEAHAKINFTLQVLGRRPEGYHDLRSIVLPVPLHDDVHIDEAREVMVAFDADSPCLESGLADLPQ